LKYVDKSVLTLQYLSNNTPRKDKLRKKNKEINNKYTKAIKKIEEHKETSDDLIKKVD